METGALLSLGAVMSYLTMTHRYVTMGAVGKSIAYAMFITVALGATHTWAYMDDAGLRSRQNAPRGFRADVAPNVVRHCVPATGAQVLGGFAGPYDWLDPMTGEICTR